MVVSGAGACATEEEEEEEDQEDEIADLDQEDGPFGPWDDGASVCCQADMEVETYVGSFVEDDDMEPTDQPVPLGEQGMEVVKDDPRRRIARHAWSSLHCPCQQH